MSAKSTKSTTSELDFSGIVVPNTNYRMTGHVTGHLPVEGGLSYTAVLDGKKRLKVPCFIFDGSPEKVLEDGTVLPPWPGVAQFEPFGDQGPVFHFEQKWTGRVDDDGNRVMRWEITLPQGFEPLGLEPGYLWLRAK